MKRPFLTGVLVALAGAALIGLATAALVVWSGVVDVAATNAGGLADRVLDYASTRAIRRHAPREKNPLAGDGKTIARGLEQYRTLCVACHGGPGADSAEFAAGMHPDPPDLAAPDMQAFTDGMLFETIARGIGSTGMPAFGAGRSKDDIWSIVAFVRHLPSLTAAEKRALAAAPVAAETKAQGGGEQEPAAASAKGGVHAVAITGFKFNPPAIEVAAGDVVEWTNKDFVAHTATADDRSFDTGRIDAGQAKRVTIRKAGTFGYFCRYHAAMRGTVTAK